MDHYSMVAQFEIPFHTNFESVSIDHDVEHFYLDFDHSKILQIFVLLKLRVQFNSHMSDLSEVR